MRFAAAIHWYKRGEISQENAAQVAALDRTDFLLALAREGEDAFVVDFADLERELQRGCKCGCYASPFRSLNDMRFLPEIIYDPLPTVAAGLINSALTC